MMRPFARLALCAFALLGVRAAQAAPDAALGDRLFDDGNAAFLAGDLPRAIAAYQALLEERIASPELETNLGAALLRQGQRGPAALHFERALFLDPGADDARADLVELRRSNVDRLEGEAEESGGETLFHLLAPIPGTAAAGLLILSWLLAIALFGARLLAPALGEKLPLGAASAIALSIALLSGGATLGAAQAHRIGLRRAVIVATSAPGREGPATSAASSFEVHEGTLVRIEDEQNGFARIKLTNGLAAWVPSEAVERVVPPRWN